MSSFCNSSLFSATRTTIFSLSSIRKTSVWVDINIKASRCCWESELLKLFFYVFQRRKALLTFYLCDREGEQELVCKAYDVVCICQDVVLLQNNSVATDTSGQSLQDEHFLYTISASSSASSGPDSVVLVVYSCLQPIPLLCQTFEFAL